MMLEDLFQRLYNMGIYDVMLPFLLVFTLSFATLQKSKILHAKDDKGKGRTYDAIIGMVMGLLVVIPHVIGLYPPESDPVMIINSSLAVVAVVLVGLMMVFLLLGLWGGSAAWKGKMTGWVAMICFVVVGYIFGYNAGFFSNMPSWLSWMNDPDVQALLLVFGVFGLIVWFISKDPAAEKSTVVNDIGELFGKK